MEKHRHILSVNFENIENIEKHSYIYNFGRTKNIEIIVSKEYFSIRADLYKQYDKKEMLSKNQYLFPDAIKKAMLLHLILYSQNIHIHNLTVQIDDIIEIVTIEKEQTPFVFSMVTDCLIHPFQVAWKKEEIETLLSQTKSNSDSRISSLFSLICSKSKEYETERFIYLWMSFNGMYHYFSSILSSVMERKIKRESKQLQYIRLLYEWGNGLGENNEKEKHRMAHQLDALIKQTEQSITFETLTDEKSVIVKEIKKILINPDDAKPYDIKAIGYFITQYAYYYRCNLFHAQRPVALFSFLDEQEVVCLKAINDVLEGFIEENLHQWFNQNYIRKNLYQQAEMMKDIR